ncbi:MAG TPA: 30S ribosomal protein S12 methylthiotransferase RimO [Clostridiales bacterium]|nr:30S ribosomal protein S12 methylthiotransferase RimO [Clostridiales bacterium]
MNILFISLGCDKNLVDSENMLGLINNHGYKLTDNENDADIIIINTCCFINDAKEESINTILDMAQYKENGRLKALIVTGCMAQRYKEEIIKNLPEVDGILGFTNNPSENNIIDLIESLVGKNDYKALSLNGNQENKRLLTTGGHYAYLKIADGCDKHCTYCAIPMIRGKYRSRTIESLIEEANYLAKQGVKELILVAQETTLYGRDIYGKKELPKLLKELCKIDGIEWIRVLYCYPEEISDELIDTIKNEDKICKYIDIPIQHSSDRILKLMGRRTNKSDLINVINKLRNQIPDIVLRTTLITGFPSETDHDHKELIDFIKEMKFERLGVFMYSQEEDTPAYLLEPQINENIKKKRHDEIMQIQQEIAFEYSKSLIGKTLNVLIEGQVVNEENIYIGRTYLDLPNIDGYIFVESNESLITGNYINTKVIKEKGYDLIGKALEGY